MQVLVTESTRVSIPMKVAGVTQKIEVQANVSQLQTDSVALGRVVDNRTIRTLPLAARNFTQIVDRVPDSTCRPGFRCRCAFGWCFRLCRQVRGHERAGTGYSRGSRGWHLHYEDNIAVVQALLNRESSRHWPAINFPVMECLNSGNFNSNSAKI